jgi:phosphoesterase RecJ-like protein
LAAHGIDVTEIVRPLFKDSSLVQLKLWGFILENMRRNDKDVVAAAVTNEDLRNIGARASDTGGIIDLMCTVPDASFAMLLAEDKDVVKGSLRTQRDDVNLSDLASQFGGGGHPKASGFRVHGKLEKQVSWKIVPSQARKAEVL